MKKFRGWVLRGKGLLRKSGTLRGPKTVAEKMQHKLKVKVKKYTNKGRVKTCSSDTKEEGNNLYR